jgi:lipopolysaccharide transport system permease protein
LNSFITPKKPWQWEIKPDSFWFQWRLGRLWHFRHLLLRLVRRDFLIHHQQTLLGPLWIIFQPIIILLTYILIFNLAVGLSTDGIAPSLFYLSGIILWSLFSDCFTGTSFTFIQNGKLFEKVYFPRIIIPLSAILVNLVRFGIQFLIFFVMLMIMDDSSVMNNPMQWITALLFTTTVVAGFGMGLGLIFSIITAKYRDLVNVIHLIVRLLMFATPIIYPLSVVDPGFRKWMAINPLCSMVELFRASFLGQGTYTQFQVIYSIGCTAVLIIFGSMLFNKYGNKLQDVI